MTGLALDFSNGRARINFGATRAGNELQMQGVLVVSMTWPGSDIMFPDKGTGLQAEALSGSLYNLQAAIHAANFTSAKVTSFMKTNCDAWTIGSLTMTPVSFNNQRMQLDYQGLDASGNTIYFNANL